MFPEPFRNDLRNMKIKLKIESSPCGDQNRSGESIRAILKSNERKSGVESKSTKFFWENGPKRQRYLESGTQMKGKREYNTNRGITSLENWTQEYKIVHAGHRECSILNMGSWDLIRTPQVQAQQNCIRFFKSL